MDTRLCLAASDLISTLVYSSENRVTIAARTSDMTPCVCQLFCEPSRGTQQTHLDSRWRQILGQDLVQCGRLLDEQLGICIRSLFIQGNFPVDILDK